MPATLVASLGRRPGIVASLGLLLLTAGVLLASGLAASDLVRFAAWTGLGITLPGVVWIRALRRRAAHPAEDAALGLVLGYSCVIALYLLGRAAGIPLLVVAWPAGTLIAVVVVPRLRQAPTSAEPLPPSWWLATATILAVLVVQGAMSFWAGHPLGVTHRPYLDMAYHLALIGELRYHVPPVVPFVLGEPLAYHWLFYAEAAATSWVTGIEPQVLLYRLEVAPMLAAFVVLTAAAVRRFTPAWWAGPLAAGLALFVATARPYDWVGIAVPETWTLLRTWISPTNTFGLALGAGALVLLIDRLGPVRPPRREWIATTILVLTAMGAKASIGPVLACGLIAVVAAGLVIRRRIDREALLALVIVVLSLAVVVAVLFGGTTGGVRVGDGALLRTPVILRVGVPSAGILPTIVLLGAALIVTIVLWTGMWGGILALVRDRSILTDPRLVLMAAMAAAAAGAALLLLYPGMSQLYYLRGATGIFGILAAVGIARLTPAGAGWRTVGWVIACILAGTAMVTVVRLAGGADAPKLAQDHVRGVVLAVILPVGALAAAVGATWGVLRVVGRSRPQVRAASGLLLVGVAIGFSVPASVGAILEPLDTATSPEITGDDIAAARWLRDNSRPDDLVATNLHCLPIVPEADTCDARHFWVSGYGERRVLVEGWAYTASAFAYSAATGKSDRTLPFWDQDRLAANDAVFTAPTAANVAVLRDQHGVRWLFAKVSPQVIEALSAVATLRHRTDEIGIFELTEPVAVGRPGDRAS